MNGDSLLKKILNKENLRQAYKRVMENHGAAGVDGIFGKGFAAQIKSEWAGIQSQLECGSYRPRAVKRVEIPKANGVGIRKLGLPSYMDRMIQQAISQELTAIYDPDFSEQSYGFRNEKNAHQALRKAQEYIHAGYSHVVDLDLEQFFDRVNHDYLMNELSKRIMDKEVLRLIHRLLRAPIDHHGQITACKQGVPQGGPLSPLLSNILLDKLDKELEKRGHKFIRYADDISIYVKSKRAGDRVMESITQYIEKELKLKVNIEKSTVTRPWFTRLLGFSFYHKKGKEKGIRVHSKSISSYKDKIRQLTQRNQPVPMGERLHLISSLNQGWGGYFRLSESVTIFRELDKWVRSRVRLCYWKQWKRVKTRIRKLKELGICHSQAYQWGNTRRGYWRVVHSPILTRSLSESFLEKVGLVSLKSITSPRKSC